VFNLMSAIYSSCPKPDAPNRSVVLVVDGLYSVRRWLAGWLAVSAGNFTDKSFSEA